MHKLSWPSLAVLALSIAFAAPASAESVKVTVNETTHLYFEGAANGTGAMYACVDGAAYGGYYNSFSDRGAYDGDPCPTSTGTLTAPDDVLEQLPPPPGGGDPPPTCDSPQTCEDMLRALCATLFSGHEMCSTEPPSGGGGEPPTLPSCDSPGSCETVLRSLCATLFSGNEMCSAEPPSGGGGEPPALPGSRDCASASGGGAIDATCLGTEQVYVLGKEPGDGPGEVGVCTPAGYFWGSGPDAPDGGAGDPCPSSGAGPGEGDGDGGGAPSEGDGDGGSEPAPRHSSGVPDESGQRPTGTAPARPQIDITRSPLRVTRAGRVGIPLACVSAETACTGDLHLTATRRTASGRRVRVVIARAGVKLDGGRSQIRRVRLTEAGRRMVAKRKRVSSTARVTLFESEHSVVVHRERVVLRGGR